MRTDTTDPTRASDATDGRDDYRRAVLTLRLVKLALGVLVSALTALRLLGVV
ncbi:hypothetical protein [Salinigranum halophilum]|jgi:hypothetical protein|uniref:hypothetical protein n=1 Tax=Salinigranum halophilum TaxID=2565931 RepID=UPI00137584EF|nr:hypothetical protein [Salinigranum halophilum]